MNIKVTNEAINKIKENTNQNASLKRAYRIFIEGQGWGGPAFGLALDEQKSNDESHEKDGMKFIVSKDLLDVHMGFEIVYKGLIRKRVVVKALEGGGRC